MVTLFVPFRNEVVDMLDRIRFIQICSTKEQATFVARKTFEANINIGKSTVRLGKRATDDY